MPQNSTIILSLFYHLSSSFRVHHSPPIIINAPSFRLNHSYHLSSSFRVHHSPPIITMRHHSVSIIHTTYHHHFASIIHHLSSQCAIIPSQSFIPPIIIISRPSFTTYHHNAPSFRLNHSYHLSFTTYHHQCAIIPSQSFIIISPLFRTILPPIIIISRI